MAFADDNALVGLVTKGVDSAIVLTAKMKTLFLMIEMCVNLSKSSVINIKQGEPTTENIKLPDGSAIPSVKLDEPIKYLGISLQTLLCLTKKHFFIELENTLKFLHFYEVIKK